MTGTLVLDSEGVAKTILQDRPMMARLALARLDGLRVVASAATVVEARNPKVAQARFDWAISHFVIEPVTEQTARAAAKLLADHGLAGHRHAIDAIVAVTALAAPPPRIIVTSDPEDLSMLCGPGVRIAMA